MDTSKIKALIALLDDPNEEVYSTVQGELLKEPVDVIPELEKAWETSVDGVFQKRVENIIHTLQINDISIEVKTWLLDDKRDLLQGAYLVAKYHFPELTMEAVKEKLADLRKDIWMELNEHLTSLEKIRIVNHVLFDVHKFSRNSSRFLAPENNYLNEVLSSHKGNPISLSVIYSLLCRDLGMPVYGVNLPKNFILVYMDESIAPDEGIKKEEATVLFYINPINKGAVLGRREIEYFIKQQKLQPDESYFLPCDNTVIIRRLFNNLKFAYDNKGDEDKKEEIQKILTLFDDYS
ncbi:MAG: transglutaminase family protein [Marinilabiliaceae bacterium]|nr:transglutaminase family protein [Marinilabiliaceae bacterium]